MKQINTEASNTQFTQNMCRVRNLNNKIDKI